MSDDLDLTCPSCGAPMRPSLVTSQRTGTERRVFECRRCGHSDSCPSEAASGREPKPIPTMWPLN